ncbi:MAG: hypothetical protein GX593_02420 [Actinomycetales bacterium]|nr:hypothetical protein [Actinomycetales bacterium]
MTQPDPNPAPLTPGTDAALAASDAPAASAPRARATALRVLTAAAILVSAVMHLVLYAEWAKNLSPLGEAFLAQAIAGVLLAGVVLVWRSPLALVAAVLYGAGSIAAFSLSAATGFLGVTAQLVGWQDYVTKGAEAVTVIAALAALAAERRRSR